MKVIGPCKQEVIDNLSEHVARAISTTLNLETQDEVFVSKFVSIGHYTFKNGVFAVLSITEGTPDVGEILSILSVSHITYFVCHILKTLWFDEHYHAYAVCSIKSYKFLHDYHPLSQHNIQSERGNFDFIATRYKLI